MLTHPQFDPVAIHIGPLGVHWYGLMYVIGFISFLVLGKMRARRPDSPIKPEQVDDMMFYGALGVVIGGRIGYMLFYNFPVLMDDPLSLFKTWNGGMSFHGGMLGVFLAALLLARKWKLTFFQISDFIAPMIPVGLGAGRIGNFINGELWGKPTDVPWGMVFPQANDGLVRHPQQLYQAFFEGLVLFTVLWLYSKKPRPVGAVSGLFMIGYGTARIVEEFFREPDAHIGYLAWGWVTMGQILSLPMIIFGVVLMWFALKRGKLTGKTNEAIS
jgi:phosphatidylglycerol:prolipoprotein diacylglycerol transferase